LLAASCWDLAGAGDVRWPCGWSHPSGWAAAGDVRWPCGWSRPSGWAAAGTCAGRAAGRVRLAGLRLGTCAGRAAGRIGLAGLRPETCAGPAAGRVRLAGLWLGHALRLVSSIWLNARGGCGGVPPDRMCAGAGAFSTACPQIVLREGRNCALQRHRPCCRPQTLQRFLPAGVPTGRPTAKASWLTCVRERTAACALTRKPSNGAHPPSRLFAPARRARNAAPACARNWGSRRRRHVSGSASAFAPA
jgi:hypothetical protein